MRGHFFSVIILACCIACHTGVDKNSQQPVSITKEQLIEMNKAKIAEENEQIDALILRRQWPVAKTETGVNYWVYEEGNGVKIEKGDLLQCDYTLSLINSDEIYNSTINGPLVFKISKSDLPSGLEEVLLLLRQGDKAKIIVPSYLAYGLAGDNHKIPSSATLIYDIYIRQVEQKQ